MSHVSPDLLSDMLHIHWVCSTCSRTAKQAFLHALLGYDVHTGLFLSDAILTGRSLMQNAEKVQLSESSGFFFHNSNSKYARLGVNFFFSFKWLVFMCF